MNEHCGMLQLTITNELGYYTNLKQTQAGTKQHPTVQNVMLLNNSITGKHCRVVILTFGVLWFLTIFIEGVYLTF